MFWRMIQWFKEHGYRYCDLAGIAPERQSRKLYLQKPAWPRTRNEASLLGEFDLCQKRGERLAYKLGAGQGRLSAAPGWRSNDAGKTGGQQSQKANPF